MYIAAVDFGFSKVLWVFSGRRGVHCWVQDATPLQFGTAERHAILQYLSPVQVCILAVAHTLTYTWAGKFSQVRYPVQQLQGPHRSINMTTPWDPS